VQEIESKMLPRAFSAKRKTQAGYEMNPYVTDKAVLIIQLGIIGHNPALA
jgi:hypothetical protein